MSSPNVTSRTTPPRAQSNICVLWLLICKTAKFQLANTLTSVIIILGPILVFFIYSATGLLQESQQETVTINPPININTSVPHIYYSPKNSVVNGIIADVVRAVQAKGSKGFASAKELEIALIEDSAFVGIEFADSFRHIDSLPPKVEAALRFPMHLRTNLKLRWDGRVLYKRMYLGTDYYKTEGFLIVQTKLSEALIRAKNTTAILPEVTMKHFPEPNRMENTFTESRVALAGFLFLPFTVSSAYLAQLIVEERRKEVRAMMRLSGVRGWAIWLSWYIVGFLLFFIPTIVLVSLLKWRFYPMSDYSVVLVFFCVYILEVLASALMISAIFSDSIGVQVSILFLHLFSWLPWRLMVMGYQTTISRAIIACLFLNSALSMGLEEFIAHENLFMGMQWNRVFLQTDPVDSINLGIIMIVMLVGTLLRILILWYVEELKGVRTRKWYFPFQPSSWGSNKWRRRNRNIDVEGQESEEEQDPEPLSHRNRAVIIRIRHVDKVFHGHKVIRDLSLNCYQDEITVFLGHNDSGKSTTFRMLAGIEEPSAGEITINGFNLATQQGKALRSMSMCPQKNVLFEKLKVRWHIKFYCRLQGMNRKEACAEADKYLEIAHMEEFASTKVQDLSSGFKRMLALCCSLCGHPTVILLDEPGTGMDPLLRREMWDMLRRERKGRCIVMSTHNMLEAEVVADRVVVLCDGQVIGYGTTGFLTQIADSGAAYFLICTKRDACLVSEVTHFLQSRSPNIQLAQEYGIYVTYKLPAKDVDEYSRLFQDLEASVDELMIKEFTVRAPALGDIFLRIGEEMMAARDQALSIDGEARSSPMTSLINLLPSFEVREDDGGVKCCNQWRAIMERKRIFTCRHWRLFLLIILIPVIIAVLLIAVELLIFFLDRPIHVIPVTDLSYVPASTVVLEAQGNITTISEKYIQNALGHGVKVRRTGGVRFADYLMDLMLKDEMNLYHTIVAGSTINTAEGTIVAYANKKLEHGSALSLGLVYESLAKAVAQLEILVVNKPHAGTLMEVVRGLKEISSRDFAIVVLLYLIVGTAIFAVMPVLERQTSLQHQQLSMGMWRVTYWLSHLFWDYCVYIAMILTLIIIDGGSVPMIVLLLSFGFAGIVFTYLVCLLSDDLGKMFSIMMYVNMIGVLAVFIHPKSGEERYRVFEVVLLAHPHYALFCGVQDIVQIERSMRIYHGSKATKQSESEDPPEVTHDWLPIRYLLVSGFVYLTLILMSGVPRRITYMFRACKNEKILPAYEDEDVEVDRIRRRLAFITTKDYKTFPLIMKDVSKRYGDVIAVRALTLDINPFECVCLIGRNGAGKSSTFYMVVGKRSLTVGNLHIKGYSIKGYRSKEGLKHVGFCPNEDILAPYMTGRETLRYFCLINGIRRSHVRMVVKELAENFRLVAHMDERISTYSNGTKQKLMIAVAALAPTLLCLDEPTDGVDMSAKYEIWDILEGIRLGGRAILLTTHSMEECEMLATNVGILDRGSLLCYGSLARLRARFDKGIFVKIKVGTFAEMSIAKAETDRLSAMEVSRPAIRSTMASLKLSVVRPSLEYDPRARLHDEESTSSETDIREDYEFLLKDVEEVFLEDHPYSSVSEKYSYRGMITFVIPKEKISWWEIFYYMEDFKKDLQVQYYSISHTTLEDVFMEFVKTHNDE